MVAKKMRKKKRERVAERRIRQALRIASGYAQIDGAHHKLWAIDQMVRVLTGCRYENQTMSDMDGKTLHFEALGSSRNYEQFVRNHNCCDGDPEAYSWDIGIPP